MVKGDSELEKLERMWPSETENFSLNQTLDRWVSERGFPDPESAIKALSEGERLKEASASFFWYCYSSLDDLGGKASLIQKKLRKKDNKAAETLLMNSVKNSSQLDAMPGKFTLGDIKYPTGHDPYVEVLVGAGLIILLSKKRIFYKDAQELITMMDDSKADAIIDGHEIGISIRRPEAEKDDDTYRLLGDVPEFLAELARVIIWDSFNAQASKKKDYREYFITAVKIVSYCGGSLASLLVILHNIRLHGRVSGLESLNDLPGEVDWDDISIHLPYSGFRSLDMDYFSRIMSIWDDVKEEVHKPEDWQEMLNALNIINAIFKYRYHPNKDKSSGIRVEMLEPEVEEIENTINSEISLCKVEIERPSTIEHILQAREELLEKIITKYFFPKGLDRQFERGTFKLVMEVEKAWQCKDFGTMTDKMRQALESETLATLPFLKFTTKIHGPQLLATRIREAIITNEEGVSDKIDSLQSITKQAKTQLKKQLPGFIGTVVDARNFFMKDAPYSKRDKREKYKEIAGNIHKVFFGIDCEGMLPFLMRCKQAIKTVT